MKKIMLALVIVVLISTPSLAQDIEHNGIFSLHGTEWQALSGGVQLMPFPPSLEPLYESMFNFYGGQVYPEKGGQGFYLDMLVCSIFNGTRTTMWHPTYRWFGVLQPIGIGIVAESFAYSIPPSYKLYELRIGVLIKTSDNWTPPEVE